MKFDEVISGHGTWLLDKEFTVPRGTSVTIVAPPGATMMDRLGKYIETYAKTGGMMWPLPLELREPADPVIVTRERLGKIVENDSGYPRTFREGDKMPDFRIHPPGDLEVRETLGPAGRRSSAVEYALRSSSALDHRAILTAFTENLSSIVRPGMGDVILAVCSYNEGLPYSNYDVDLDRRAFEPAAMAVAPPHH